MLSLATFICAASPEKRRLPPVMLARARLTPLADEAATHALLPPGVVLSRRARD